LEYRIACVVRLEGVASNQMQRIERWQLHAMPISFGHARLRIADDGGAAGEPPPRATLTTVASQISAAPKCSVHTQTQLA
jgi:hypothetical protein